MPLLRYAGKAWMAVQVVIAILGTFGALGFIAWATGRLPEEEREGLGAACIICIAATMLTLLPFALAKGMSLVVSVLGRLRELGSGPADELPYRYRRACTSCGFQWMWKPGDPQRKPRPRWAPALSRKPVAGGGRRSLLSKQSRRELHWVKARAYRPFLDELLAHWSGTHEPDVDFLLHSSEEAVAFFHDYQRALGEDPEMKVGHRVAGFIRNYHPLREEIVLFVRAYQHLRRGDRATATRGFQGLARTCPQFAEPWIWLSATADAPGRRSDCLTRAIGREPAHPLALDAQAVIQGEASLSEPQRDVGESAATIVRCPRCGGSLRHELGTEEITCQYCSYRAGIRDGDWHEAEEPPLVTTLRLQRRMQGPDWSEVAQTLHCQACGAELGMALHLAGQCAYCGSTNVLMEEDVRTLLQPDSLLPFVIDERQVSDALREAVRAGSGVFRGRRSLKIRSLRGVYVPFWVFDGTVEARWVETSASGELYSAQDRRIKYHDLAFPGVDVPPPSLLDQVGPFRLRKLVSYEARLLADWPAQLYTLDVEVVVEDAYDTMLLLSRRRAGLPAKVEVSWEDKAPPAETRRTFQVSGVTYQLALLPVWVALLEVRKGRSLALVNGQTGKVAMGPTLRANS